MEDLVSEITKVARITLEGEGERLTVADVDLYMSVEWLYEVTSVVHQMLQLAVQPNLVNGEGVHTFLHYPTAHDNLLTLGLEQKFELRLPSQKHIVLGFHGGKDCYSLNVGEMLVAFFKVCEFDIQPLEFTVSMCLEVLKRLLGQFYYGVFGFSGGLHFAPCRLQSPLEFLDQRLENSFLGRHILIVRLSDPAESVFRKPDIS